MLTTIENISQTLPVQPKGSQKQVYIWGSEHGQAFEPVKGALISAQVLGFLQKEGIFVLNCNSSGTAIGIDTGHHKGMACREWW